MSWGGTYDVLFLRIYNNFSLCVCTARSEVVFSSSFLDFLLPSLSIMEERVVSVLLSLSRSFRLHSDLDS